MIQKPTNSNECCVEWNDVQHIVYAKCIQTTDDFQHCLSYEKPKCPPCNNTNANVN